MKKISVDICSYIKTGIMGFVGILAWFYSSYRGTTGEGMELIKVLSMIFLLIGIIGIIVTKYLSSRPLKSVGVVNKNDEMFEILRAKAAQQTLDIFNVVVFLFIILTGTEILKIKFSLYWLGIIVFVGLNAISIACLAKQSNKMM